MIELDRLSLFIVSVSTDKPFCVISRSKGQKPIVCAYFPEVIAAKLKYVLPTENRNGGWRLGSSQTTLPLIRDWLDQHGALEALLTGETLIVGDWRKCGGARPNFLELLSKRAS